MKDIINNMQKGLSEYSPGANTAVIIQQKYLMLLSGSVTLWLTLWGLPQLQMFSSGKTGKKETSSLKSL